MIQHSWYLKEYEESLLSRLPLHKPNQIQETLQITFLKQWDKYTACENTKDWDLDGFQDGSISKLKFIELLVPKEEDLPFGSPPFFEAIQVCRRKIYQILGKAPK